MVERHRSATRPRRTLQRDHDERHACEHQGTRFRRWNLTWRNHLQDLLVDVEKSIAVRIRDARNEPVSFLILVPKAYTL